MKEVNSKLDKALTREGLREILKVNFEIYKDEPDFYDYITTLVIYLMQYEYCGDAAGAAPPLTPSERSHMAAPSAPAESVEFPRLQKVHAVSTRYKVHDGCCPQCNSPVPKDRNICPYCLAMIEQ